MKHVIVINTVDPPEGKPLSIPFQTDLIQKIEKLVQAEVGKDLRYTVDRFNVDSAIEAVHEMYNAPKWNRGETWAQLVGALQRATYLLRTASEFITDNPVKDYAVYYDEADCDAMCLRDDCDVAIVAADDALIAAGEPL
jgi:hypothetical protein